MRNLWHDAFLYLYKRFARQQFTDTFILSDESPTVRMRVICYRLHRLFEKDGNCFNKNCYQLQEK